MRRPLIILLTVCLIMSAVTAWAYWSAGSATGGNGAAAVSSVNQGATPTASAAGNAVTVAWAPTTLATGQAVNGYTVKRYSGSTAQTILTACTGVVTSTSCVESNVPTGIWTYSVTPLFATNWVGVESAKSSTVVVGNLPPVAVADSYSVAEDAVLTVGAPGVLGNDSDPNSDPLTAILASGVANGALSFSANGGFTYTPNPNFNGSDSFSYKANDGTLNSNIVAVTLTVTAINDAPLNSVPGPQQTPKNTNRVFSTATNNPISISDADAGGATVQVQLTATHGTVTLPVLTNLTFTVGDGTSDATMTFTGTIANINLRLNGATFIPTNNFTGAATLQIVTSDLGNTGSGGTLTDTDSVTINVNALGIFTAKQDIGGPSLAGDSSYSGGANGTYTVNGGGADIWGTADQFQYLYRDLTGDGRLTAKVSSSTQTPLPINTGAKAGVMFRESTAAGSKHAMMDLMQTAGTEFMFRATTDGSTATSGTPAAVVAPYWIRITRVGNVITGEYSPDGATWTIEGTAQTVAMNASIKVGLSVTAHDNTKLNIVTYDNVKLTTPPTAVADAYTTNENTTLTVAASGVLANDTDPESDALTAVLVSGPAGLTLNANGSFAYVPAANFVGATSFTYKANDGVFDSNTITVNLTVNPANQVPSFTKGANQSVSQTFGAQTVAGWATAISQGTSDSGQLVDFVVTNNNNPLFSVQPAVGADGTLTYTPAGTTGVATVSVRIHDNGGTANGGSDLSAVQTFTITITPDTTGPTGGSVDASGLVGTGSRYAASTTLSLVLAKGTDPNGVAATGNLLKRATATLTSGGTANGTCGAFGSYTLVSGGTDPASPMSDTVADQACYSYQYVVLDTLGNPTTYTSPDIKVDLTPPPAPSLAHSAFTNTYWSSGSIVYYRSAASTGSFTTTSTATDTKSGIASYTFPALGTNWTSTPGALGVNTYSWSGAPAVPGTMSITATNNATGVSGSTSFTPTSDDTAPSAGSVTPPNTTQVSTSVSVAYATGTDGGSGLGTRLLQRQSATLTGTTCGSYGGWTTVATNPASSPFSDTVTAGFCYQYQYVVADNVGNTNTATSTNVVKVAVACGTQLLGNPGFENGATTTPWTASTGVVTNAGSVAAHTGAWKALLGGNGTVSTETVSQDVSIPANCTVSLSYWLRVTTSETSGPYDYFQVQVINGTTTTVQSYSDRDFGTTYVQRTVDLSAYAGQTITLRFLAVEDLSLQTSFWLDDVSLTTGADVTGPTGGSVDASGLVGTGSRYAASTTLSLVLAKGTDPSGVATTGNQLLRASASLTNGTCGTFGSYTLVSGGTDPVSPKSDTVSDQACYSYQYVVLDTLANSTTYTSPAIKVDLTAPAAPSLAFSGFTNTYWPGSGTTVFYRSGATSGSFVATATATDAGSGIGSYSFPTLGTNWTSTPGALGVNTYSWSGAPAVPGTMSITATNNATGVSGGTSFTPTADDTAPSAGSVTPPNTTQASTSVSVAFATGTDGGAGLGTRLLQRQSATLTGSTCGSYGGWTTVATNPASSPFSDTVTAGFCYKYQYVVADNVGNLATATSANVVKVTTYLSAITGTGGLLSYWRLGEATTSSDSFSGSATGSDLSAHTGEIGATWTLWQNPGPTGLITSEGRLRRNNVGAGVQFLSSGIPASPDYLVEADIYVKSLAAADDIGITGRILVSDASDPGTTYGARYHEDAGVAQWELRKNAGGTGTLLASFPQTLTVGSTYRIGLDMNGSTIRLLVDGVVRGSVTDTSITGAGRAGVRLGSSTATATQGDTVGLHLDNFRVSPPLADSTGTNNHGDYLGGPTLGNTGAIAGDADTAALFDGVNDYGTVARQIGDDFSIEFWFKSTQNYGSTCTQWWQGAGLVDAEFPGLANDFGVSLCQGKVIGGVGGTTEVSIVTSGTYNNGAWHHVVFTRTKTSGALALYVDGVAAGTATGSTVSLTSPANINFGRLATAIQYYAGSLDEISVYTSVLSGATVSAHYAAAQ